MTSERSMMAHLSIINDLLVNDFLNSYILTSCDLSDLKNNMTKRNYFHFKNCFPSKKIKTLTIQKILTEHFLSISTINEFKKVIPCQDEIASNHK